MGGNARLGGARVRHAARKVGPAPRGDAIVIPMPAAPAASVLRRSQPEEILTMNAAPVLVRGARRRLAGLLFLAATAATARAQEILHHEIHVRLRPAEGVLEGDCTITLAPATRPARAITFDLLDGAVLSVEVDGRRIDDFRYGGDEDARKYELRRLIVPLPARPAEATCKVRVRYRDDMVSASATNPEDNKPFSLAQVSAEHGSFSSHVPWYPYVTYAGRGADLHFTVPEGQTVVSSGTLVGVTHDEAGWATFHWHSDQGSGLLPYPFACGAYRVLETIASDGKTPLSIHYLPEDAKFARQKMAILRDVFTFYLQTFGSYPFPKLAVVETDLLEGNIGLAAQSVVMLSRKVWFADEIHEEDTQLTNRPLLVLADETAHQWNAYKVASPNWLAEGISRYTDSLYMAHRGGEAVLGRHMAFTRMQYFNLLKGGAKDIAISDPAVTPSLYFIKGALALDLLRARLGEERFLDGMRGYFDDNAGKVTDLAAFRAAFEAATDEPLDWFFAQWFERGGHPALAATWRSRRDDEGFVTTIHVTQQQRGPPFRVDLPIALHGAGDQSVRLELTAADQSFEVRSSFEPETLKIDPELRMPLEAKVAAAE
jgi:aminopeptidase N